MKGNNFVPQVKVKSPNMSEERRKTSVLIFERLSEDEKNKIKKACFDASLYKQDKLGFESMEEYEANNKTTIFNPKFFKQAIYEVLFDRISKNKKLDSNTLKEYINNIISFNINNIRTVRDFSEGAFYSLGYNLGTGRARAKNHFQSSKQINECLEEFLIPGETVELDNEEINKLLKITDKEKERIKEFSFLDTNIRKEPFYDYRTVESELEEAVFKRLIQIEGLKVEDIFNKKFDYRQIYKKLYSIIERNTKKIELVAWYLKRKNINLDPLDEEQIDAFLNEFDIAYELEKEEREAK